MWVTKLLISPVKKRIFCPKTTKFGPKLAFLVDLGQAMQAYSVPCWWVGWWLLRAGCISQDTYLLYVDCRKTKKRFAVHPSHYFPVKKLLKHVGTHLKSRLDAIQRSDYFRDRQTDRLTKAVHTHQHYVQIIPRFPLRGRRPPSPASGLCSPAAN